MFNDGGVDTCFALLFLSRVNLAKDLTVSLRGKLDELPGAKPRADEEAKTPRPAVEPMKPEPPAEPPPVRRAESPPPASPGRAPSSASDLDVATERLSQKLVSAPVSEQEELIEQFKAGKGVVFTQALAAAIHRLHGPAQERARDALEERLTRMTGATLRGRFSDSDAEIRRAAAGRGHEGG